MCNGKTLYQEIIFPINLKIKLWVNKTIKSFEWGLNNSPEGLDKGLTHCFFVTFDSEKDRDEYLPHPAHQEFVAILKPHLEDAVVVDYWAN